MCGVGAIDESLFKRPLGYDRIVDLYPLCVDFIFSGQGCLVSKIPWYCFLACKGS